MLLYLPKEVANETDNEQREDQRYSHLMCSIQANLMIFFELGQFFWGSAITNSIYLNVINFSKRHQETKNKHSRIAYYIIGIFLPLIYVICILSLGYSGPAGHYCWIKTNNNTTSEIVLVSIYLLIIWGNILYNFKVIFNIIGFIRKEFQFDEEGVKVINSYKRGLIVYPIACVVIVGPATFFRVIGFFTKVELQFIQEIFTLIVCLQGFVYSIGYGLNKQIIAVIVPTVKMIFCCKSISDSADNTSNSNIDILTTGTHKRTTTTTINVMNTIHKDSFISDTYITYDKDDDKYSLSSQKVIDMSRSERSPSHK
jgi:heme/copper-type cytochrome/quinol oxidase subunit 2